MNISSTNPELFQSPQVFTDLNQLNTIRRQGERDEAAALKAVSKQFESMFTQIMLKSMRSANEVFAQDNPLNTPEMKFRQQMFDDQLSITLSEGRGLGIADVLYRQLSRQFVESDNSAQAENGLRTNSAQPYTDTHTVPQRIKDARAMNALASPDDFIQLVTPYAKQAAEKLGTDYRYLAAQSALETGWGQHVLRDQQGNHSFNLFNIKADSRWSGRAVTVPTIEYNNGLPQTEIANFRRYSSIADSFADYEQFLQQPRYQHALEQSADPQQFIRELHGAGYATDPNYVKKIESIVNQYFSDTQSVKKSDEAAS